jgi:general secretion pathway protein I
MASERGFTLLEVLIAFVIAALALGVMFDAALGGLRATTTASHYQEALSLARSHLAAVGVLGITAREASGDDGRGFHWKVTIKPAGTVAVPRGLDEDPAMPQARLTLYAVSVVETWAADGGERQVQLDSARLGLAARSGR